MCRLLSLAVLVAATARLSAQTPAPAARAVEAITAQEIARHISVISDDSMLGRNTPGPGIEMAARYVADQFAKFGLEPGGDNGTWVQRYRVPGGTATAPNVVGILQGGDPKLKDEYVVFVAHMDAQGIASGQQADSIKNGADDNASGTAGVIELAKAFSRPGARPRRSLIFLAVSGEEKMGWGSRYFMAHPPRAIQAQQVVASINLDMIGRNAIDSILVSGTRESDLGAVVDRVVAAHPELPMSPVASGHAFMFSSDHYFFAEKGVPVLYFKNGSGHGDYHRVTDSSDKIDPEKPARVTRLVFFVGQEIANAAQRPQWNDRGRQGLQKVQQGGPELAPGVPMKLPPVPEPAQ
jgi:hypothetical protein